MKIITTLLFGSLLISNAQATAVTALSNGTVIPMPEVNLRSVGPIVQAPGITWTGTFGSRLPVYGFTQRYGFNANGEWINGTPMAGANTGAFTYTFDTLVKGVGGLLNYSPTNDGPAVISIFDASHKLIESTTLSFATASIGEFHGFELANAGIKYFELGGGFVGLRDLTVQYAAMAPVPEPHTYATLLMGMGVLGAVVRRKAKTKARPDAGKLA